MGTVPTKTSAPWNPFQGAGDYPLARVLESKVGSVPDVVEHIEHHAGGEGGQQYVIADAHPVVTVRRGVEAGTGAQSYTMYELP